MPLLIKNGRIITASDDYKADIYCADETITRIEKSIDAKKLPKSTEVVNAAGKYVFPGFIDPHVHIYLPFMGTFSADDYESASKAALAGGTTTLIEMICPGPKDDPWEAYQLWRAQAKKKAAVDYTYHMSIVRFEPKVRAQFTRIVKDGVPSFKVFLAYKGALEIRQRGKRLVQHEVWRHGLDPHVHAAIAGVECFLHRIFARGVHGIDVCAGERRETAELVDAAGLDHGRARHAMVLRARLPRREQRFLHRVDRLGVLAMRGDDGADLLRHRHRGIQVRV